MPVQRFLPTPGGAAHIADKGLAPRADAYDEAKRCSGEVFRVLGKAGLLGLPSPEELGGGGPPYEVYLQALEELASRWVAVAAVSVHVLSCFPLAMDGNAWQQECWLQGMLAGDQRGAYSLSEPQAGSDAAALVSRAVQDGDVYGVSGNKAWIISWGKADDVYTRPKAATDGRCRRRAAPLFARTGFDRARGVSCCNVPAITRGLTFGRPGDKMGVRAATTTSVSWAGLRCSRTRWSDPPAGACRSPSWRWTQDGSASPQWRSDSPNRPLTARWVSARYVPGRCPSTRRGPSPQPRGQRREARRDERCDARDHRRGAGARGLRLHPGFPGLAARRASSPPDCSLASRMGPPDPPQAVSGRAGIRRVRHDR